MRTDHLETGHQQRGQPVNLGILLLLFSPTDTAFNGMCPYLNELTTFKNKEEGKAIIPKNVFVKPPSAELRPDQKDEDSLPPYPTLDPILRAYVEEDKGVEEIAKMGFKESMIREVIHMVDRNEYKRRQSPPGVKITHRALGKDRRLPVTNKYRNF